ncbi:MAG: 50S ribosomal protein L24 [Deltaproteobacteria bacterium]|jgi:large subunit ribosomal protein L24|nr:50S ribosomal protein L24 [Deltaproteobacteria bacterium]
MRKKSLFHKGTYLNPDGLRLCRFKVGDKLQVMTGKHRKKEGVAKAIKLKEAKVYITDVNLIWRNYKANRTRKGKEVGDRQQVEAPFHISNVALICPSCLAPTRVVYDFVSSSEPEGRKKKVRICKRCKAHIDD